MTDPLTSVETWINANRILRGVAGALGPLSMGATADDQNPPKSPADGAFCLLQLGPEPARSAVAEDDAPQWIRVSHLIFGVDAGQANTAAQAVAEQVRDLEPYTPMGSMMCLATSNISGPVSQPVGIDQWDYCQQVSGDYLLYDNSGGA